MKTFPKKNLLEPLTSVSNPGPQLQVCCLPGFTREYLAQFRMTGERLEI